MALTDFSHTADADLVRKTLAGGHAAYKELVTRYQGHVDGMDYQKVADFLDVPVGTVKSLIHRARAKLKAALPPAVTEEVSPMVQVERVFNEHRPPADLAEEVLKRIAHWERFGSAEGFPDAQGEKARAILADPQWRRLVEMELALEPMSEPCRAIRRQIACLERCHEHYVGNVEDILGMIGKMTPGRILDCLVLGKEYYVEVLPLRQPAYRPEHLGANKFEDATSHLHRARAVNHVHNMINVESPLPAGAEELPLAPVLLPVLLAGHATGDLHEHLQPELPEKGDQRVVILH